MQTTTSGWFSRCTNLAGSSITPQHQHCDAFRSASSTAATPRAYVPAPFLTTAGALRSLPGWEVAVHVLVRPSSRWWHFPSRCPGSKGRSAPPPRQCGRRRRRTRSPRTPAPGDRTTVRTTERPGWASPCRREATCSVFRDPVRGSCARSSPRAWPWPWLVAAQRVPAATAKPRQTLPEATRRAASTESGSRSPWPPTSVASPRRPPRRGGLRPTAARTCRRAVGGSSGETRTA